MAKKTGKNKKLNEIVGLCFLLVGIFTLASLFFHHPEDHPFFSSRPNDPIKNPTGLIGVYISHYSLLAFGMSAYWIALMAVFWAFCHFLQKVPQRKALKFLGFVFFLIASAGLYALFAQADAKAAQGGLVGYLLDTYLEKYFGSLGALILLSTMILLSLLLATDFLLFPMVENVIAFFMWIGRGVHSAITVTAGAIAGFIEFFSRRSADGEKRQRSVSEVVRKAVAASSSGKKDKEPKEKSRVEKEIETSFFPKDLPIKVKKYEPTFIAETKPADNGNGKKRQDAKEARAEAVKPEPKAETKAKEEPKEPVKEPQAVAAVGVSISEADAAKDYQLPLMEFLKIPAANRGTAVDDLKAKSQLLESTLRDFDIEARVVEIEQGPTITRYELLPAPGVKVASICSLQDDLALALKAASIRIIAPIPGKSAVGIEVPNSITDTVFLRELLEAPEYKRKTAKLPLTLGKDTSGKPLVADLTEMPHLLIAGATGSGKTVCVNAIIAGFLYSFRPDQLKFVMIDPKMVELAVYNSLPHMLTPVVTEVRKAPATLNWVVTEMENRYRMFARCAVRNIQGFNNRDNKTEIPDLPERLPYIVVIIDELADLMMVAQDKVETAITRLAQLSRAVGIHLILATQRPSVDVITGVIKANFPARISFKVASKVDSRTVLDVNGADKLLGKGDMLFLEPGVAKPTRGQAAFVTDPEINQVVKFIQNQKKTEYLPDLQKAGSPEAQGESGEKDELYEQAVKVILETRQASTSILQRRLRLGYGRAARILDVMQAEGIVGPPQGTKPREILVDRVAAEPSP